VSNETDTGNDITPDLPHPRATTALFGHAEAERTLLDAYRSGRIPHAWLIGGPPGIGKATLAYRFARFVLAHPHPQAPEVQQARSLAVKPDDPVARRIAAQSQNDLFALERVINEKTGKLYTVIRVEDVRRAIAFFGTTAGEGGWRVAIVDSADEFNRESANALLKVLEEPPPRALLLLVSDAPGRLLPTIRSRCRRLMLQPLDAADVAQAVAAAIGAKTRDPEIEAAAAVAEGSVGRALTLIGGDMLALRKRVTDLLARLPELDPRALHALADALARADQTRVMVVADAIEAWLTAQLRQTSADMRRAARIAAAWDHVTRAVNDADEYNLDRRPLVFSVFGQLAEAARG
jgi:DNA polymerase-3 subunit delta'